MNFYLKKIVEIGAITEKILKMKTNTKIILRLGLCLIYLDISLQLILKGKIFQIFKLDIKYRRQIK